MYCDLIHTFEKLTDVEAGQLIKHLLAYVNDRSPESDRLIEVMFEPIKQQLKRDLIKYESKRKQWSEAGKASANKRKQTLTDVESRSTVSTVSVNDTVNVNVNDNVIQKIDNGTHENLQTEAGQENPTPEKIKAHLQGGKTQLIQSAEHWRSRLTEQHKMSFRRTLLAKFPNTPENVITNAMYLYLDWWNLKHPDGNTFKVFTAWFSYYIEQTTTLPKPLDQIKYL